ncbi:Arginyl-tRNA--protein transferase 1 [Plasmodiophora brassicae]|uniref:Arginyl-tRNA--protein transferase 1 n=1 Tax=Plasmodiophora brassicae TaxID=37360 RepID=A0A0G4IS29_PLABS|nr:hypothetical protein PBRA_006169 [Plasmodiophora brassicae]SPQ96124.1 unnamed protein product [Plasmodiophora brassicae]
MASATGGESRGQRGTSRQASLLAGAVVQRYDCPYCRQGVCQASCMAALALTCHDFAELVERGWCRSGRSLYRPEPEHSCCSQFSMRMDAMQFRPTHRHKRIIRRLDRLATSAGALSSCIATNGNHEQQQQQQQQQHHRKQKQQPRNSSSSSFVADDPFSKLIASALVDLLRRTGLCDELGEIPYPYPPWFLRPGRHPGHLCSNVVNRLDARDQSGQLAHAIVHDLRHALAAYDVHLSSSDRTGCINFAALRDTGSRECDCDDSAVRASLGAFASTGVLGGFDEALLRRWHKSRCKRKKETHDMATPASSSGLDEFAKAFERMASASDSVIEITLEDCSFTEEKYALYVNYQIASHSDSLEKLTRSQFTEFIVESPLTKSPLGFGSFHRCYRLRGRDHTPPRLIAFSVIDILPSGINSQYFVWDLSFQHLSLGIFSVLDEIRLVQLLNRLFPSCRHYYMGIFVTASPRMLYKRQFQPAELYFQGRWLPEETIDSMEAVVPRQPVDHTSTASDIDADVVVFVDNQLTTWGRFCEQRPPSPSAVLNVKRYRDLVGDLAFTMIYAL